jgi:hypothetical protein
MIVAVTFSVIVATSVIFIVVSIIATVAAAHWIIAIHPTVITANIVLVTVTDHTIVVVIYMTKQVIYVLAINFISTCLHDLSTPASSFPPTFFVFYLL